MKTISKKLNSQKGVSILFALLLFLVATVVSLVIIVAASSSIKRESSFKESVVKNVELDSCLLMLKNKIDYFSNDGSGTYVFDTDDEGRYVYRVIGTDDPIKKIIVRLSTVVINREATSSEIEGNFVVSGNNLSDVKVNYQIVFDSSSSEVPASISFKFDNGSLLYSRYTFRTDNNTITWIYDRSLFKEVN